jgi:uncharacterized protein YbjT (DUF2867 family)
MKRKERPVILVAGATGRLGGLIALRLLAQGAAVRVLVRHNSPSEELVKQGRATSARSLIEAGAQPAYGDLKDRASLDAACRGIRTLITTANSAARGGEDNPRTVDLEGNRNLIDAASAAGVKQFVFVSAYIADPDSPVPFLAAKGKTEKYLRDGGMTHTIFAPDAFMESWVAMPVGRPALSGQPVTLVGSGERAHSFIATADVASFAVAALENPAALNQRLVLGGPEPLSFRDAVKVYEQVLGRSIAVRCVAPGAPVPGLPEYAWEMAADFDTYDSPIGMTETARTFGVALTPLETYVRQNSEFSEKFGILD